MKRALAILLTMSVSVVLLLVPAQPANATTVYIAKAINGYKFTVTVKSAVEKLKLATENRYGYERSKFKHWHDADRDCQNTRAEVLKTESQVATTGCSIKYGKWYSTYDGVTLKLASDVDIDHVVALAEAWDSGARGWSAARREAYANDLADPRSLIAVSDDSNQAKSDKDPVDWLPARNVCGYIRMWTLVKLRWDLKVDTAEKAFLREAAANCPSMSFTTHKAGVKVTAYTTGGSTGGTGGGTTNDPRFETCTAAKAAGYGPYVRGRDPEYYWYTDRDSDGIVCE